MSSLYSGQISLAAELTTYRSPAIFRPFVKNVVLLEKKRKAPIRYIDFAMERCTVKCSGLIHHSCAVNEDVFERVSAGITDEAPIVCLSPRLHGSTTVFSIVYVVLLISVGMSHANNLKLRRAKVKALMVYRTRPLCRSEGVV